MAFNREEAKRRLTAVQKGCKYDYDKRVRKLLVLKRDGLVFVSILLLAVAMNNSKTTDKRTNSKLLLDADQKYRIICLQQHTMTMEGSGVLNTMSSN